MTSIKNTILFLFITLSISLFAQKQYQVEYSYYSNGEKVDGRGARLINQGDISAIFPLQGEPSEYRFIDFGEDNSVLIDQFGENIYKRIFPFSELEESKNVECTDTILGFLCEKAELSINSNRIEIWFTHKAPVNGSPSISLLPNSGLVLKYRVNGNREMIATNISKLKKKDAPKIDFSEIITNSTAVDAAKYSRLQIEARYSTIPVFEKEIVNFTDYPKEENLDSSNYVYHYSNGTIILKKLNLSEIKENDYVFATLTDWSNGDAYDRTGSVFMIPENKKQKMLQALQNGKEVLPVFVSNEGKEYQGFVSDENYSVPVELMRFFTPFGVGHFNDAIEIDGYTWADSSIYKQDITGLITSADSIAWIGVFIGNYDKGGHMVSLELNHYPGEEESDSSAHLWRKTLFNTVNIMEMSGQNYCTLFLTDTLQVEFEIPENIENIELLFTTTGHGGWGGGDEFVPKNNKILIDNKIVFDHTPWRCDCGTYRTLNPASGNFGNGLSSSDLSRSNWCPGTLTQPFRIDLKNLKSGKHTLEVIIPKGSPEGNSFSSWSVSGTLVGEKVE